MVSCLLILNWCNWFLMWKLFVSKQIEKVRISSDRIIFLNHLGCLVFLRFHNGQCLVSLEQFWSNEKVLMLLIVSTFYSLENLFCRPFNSLYIVWKQFLWWLSTHFLWLQRLMYFRNYFLTYKDDRSLLDLKAFRNSKTDICLVDIRLKWIDHLKFIPNHSLLMTFFYFEQGCFMFKSQLGWIEFHQVVFNIIILSFNFFLNLINLALYSFHRPKSCLYFWNSFWFFALLFFNY